MRQPVSPGSCPLGCEGSGRKPGGGPRQPGWAAELRGTGHPGELAPLAGQHGIPAARAPQLLPGLFPGHSTFRNPPIPGARPAARNRQAGAPFPATALRV